MTKESLETLKDFTEVKDMVPCIPSLRAACQEVLNFIRDLQSQKTSKELEEEGYEFPDFESGWDELINRARPE